jgi:subtilisin family serine protease
VQTAGVFWELDRIDQRSLPLDGRYYYHYTGAGVHVYLVDNGVDLQSSQLTGRVTDDYTAVVTKGARDHHSCSHATAVATALAGKDHGPARGALVHSVKVGPCLEGGWSESAIVDGLNWVRLHAKRPAVVNLSFGKQGTSSAVNSAVTELVNSGLPVFIAAGQEEVDACTVSPAQVTAAVTVAGSRTRGDGPTRHDEPMIGSNFGSCIDLYAPGQFLSVFGSSYAAPLVAGVAALYLQRDGQLSVSTLTSRLLQSATPAKLQGTLKGTPNRLLYGRVEPRDIIAPT